MISIIIPVYNVENYLRECIDSIVSQSYPHLEIILVDDGSTDNSGLICDEYKTKDSRIVVIHKENGGLSDARNTGMEIAKGDFIGFVDSDDVIHPQMYEFLRAALLDTNADMVTCNHIPFRDGTTVRPDSLSERYQLDKTETREDYIHNFLKEDFTHYVWRCLYKKELVKSIRFQKGKRLEDIMFCGELSSILSKRAVITDKLYYYRLRSGSIMHANPHIYLEQIDSMLFTLNHFKTHETAGFTKRYAEFVMSHILNHNIRARACNTYNSHVEKEARRIFCQLYREYGSNHKPHHLARYLPFVYTAIKLPLAKKYLRQAQQSGILIDKHS